MFDTYHSVLANDVQQLFVKPVPSYTSIYKRTCTYKYESNVNTCTRCDSVCLHYCVSSC